MIIMNLFTLGVSWLQSLNPINITTVQPHDLKVSRMCHKDVYFATYLYLLTLTSAKTTVYDL